MAKLQAREITTGLRFPEGPMALPDGSVLVVEIEGARLVRCTMDGAKDVVAELGGGPNGGQTPQDGHPDRMGQGLAQKRQPRVGRNLGRDILRGLGGRAWREVR